MEVQIQDRGWFANRHFSTSPMSNPAGDSGDDMDSDETITTNADLREAETTMAKLLHDGFEAYRERQFNQAEQLFEALLTLAISVKDHHREERAYNGLFLGYYARHQY